MVAIRQRNDAVRLLWRRIAMLGFMILILFALWGVVNVYQKEQSSKTLRLQAEAQLQDLEKRETALKAQISSLETERGQEEALREAYGVGKQGEGMVQIVEKPATSTEETATEHIGWFKRIFWWW